MKKLVATGTMALLMLAATSPASAQAIITDDGDDGNFNAQFVDASQFQVAVGLQVNTGDANAAADDGSFAAAEIDQSLSITQNQFNGGVDGFFFVD